MKSIDMFEHTIFNPEIIDYLQSNDFERVDDHCDENRMTWRRKDTVIDFAYNSIAVNAKLPTDKLHKVYHICGFPPADSILFAFLMHSWQIILLEDCKKVLQNNKLHEGLKNIQLN